MVYEFTNHAPPIPDEKEYLRQAVADFNKLLLESPGNEQVFQKFFELNPCFVPGARDEFSGIGPSGHGPYLNALIRQPKVSGLFDRVPDFLWLASDSIFFTPVFVEIEAPEKKYFKKDGTPTSDFNQAKHQLEEWQTIFTSPENILKFYQDFSIPQELRELTFHPHFILIFGRREEYDKKTPLKQKRGALGGKNQTIMSYDRICPQIARRNFLCCDVKNGRYVARNLGPTFRIGPYEDQLINIDGLVNAVDNTAYISQERKLFLKEKIPYCMEFLVEEQKGTIMRIRSNREGQIEE
ncbi:Shedu anti-phage system protein SduA domain-containing protein [Mariniradius sediminis]|uniref:DUF4263 domain-containing protein n=1 Tax=Mariniradius sediminis TaxID=2909237 RepID=A0ABS9BX39_9BACT|nr:Shedu anti-phage system protein SduA domain-containing protein [Mariniradius sediminis]MCF1752621.1 DUF4263 domain-containing protein [Mariniradius sediminis]